MKTAQKTGNQHYKATFYADGNEGKSVHCMGVVPLEALRATLTDQSMFQYFRGTRRIDIRIEPASNGEAVQEIDIDATDTATMDIGNDPQLYKTVVQRGEDDPVEVIYQGAFPLQALRRTLIDVEVLWEYRMASSVDFRVDLATADELADWQAWGAARVTALESVAKAEAEVEQARDELKMAEVRKQKAAHDRAIELEGERGKKLVQFARNLLTELEDKVEEEEIDASSHSIEEIEEVIANIEAALDGDQEIYLYGQNYSLRVQARDLAMKFDMLDAWDSSEDDTAADTDSLAPLQEDADLQTAHFELNSAKAKLADRREELKQSQRNPHEGVQREADVTVAEVEADTMEKQGEGDSEIAVPADAEAVEQNAEAIEA